MANLLQQYGIKEVADVCFYEKDENGTEQLVLFLDTLKVSTIEQTAEQTEARGGKGNPPLIIWDYGKEITLNIEDALYSPQSMAIMFGAKGTDVETGKTNVTLSRMKKFTATTDGDFAPAMAGLSTAVTSYKVYAPGNIGEGLKTTTSLEQGGTYYVEYWINAGNATTLKIDADNFPGTYRVIGDTYARNASTGKDTYYQFEIPKAKMNAEQTITLEAEGDPTVFNMSLRVLRGDDGTMMKLTQYSAEIGKEDYVEGPKGE